MNRTPVYYSAEEVRAVLNWSLVNKAVEQALKAVAAQTRNEAVAEPEVSTFVSQPPRSFTKAGNNAGQVLMTMPAFVGNYQLTGDGAGGDASSVPRSTLACKLVTSFCGNRDLMPPLPNIAANILLFNVKTGELEAIMSGTDITTWRTAAASVVATKHLYFRRFGLDAQQQKEITLAIIGCGVQGEIHAAAMCACFKVKKLNLFNRTTSRAHEVATRLANSFGGEIQVCESARDAVRAADVICVATFSPTALITAADLDLKRPMHINAVGAGEVHFGEVATDIYEQSIVFVDSLANAKEELRNFPVPIVGEVGQVINSGVYPEPKAITVFQSMGMAAEDACVAEAVQSALLSR